ncbi:hypothetical protein VTJ04DRAFT_2945 [Mycothermus thermophilus]|uniref:uncharacterized protein n=1 Tax=Humicola insolens TaxID=85995 RepID=UPI0037420DA2
MGNLCGKSSRDDDPFSRPGRRLGDAPPRPTAPSASVPSSAAKAKQPSSSSSSAQPPRKVGGPPRTLGGTSGEASSPGGASAEEARAKAAAAAEARYQAAKQNRGKLGTALDKQRALTDAEALRLASEEERRRRDMDQAAEALRHS